MHCRSLAVLAHMGDADDAAERPDINTLITEGLDPQLETALLILQAKALETLRNVSLETAMEAVRALDLGLKQERLVLGEPSERTAISIEDKIEREYERWLVGSPQPNGRG